MAPKKTKLKVKIQEDATRSDKVIEEAPEEAPAEAGTKQVASEPPQPEMSESVKATEATVTTSESTKKRYGSARGVCAMYKLVVKKAQGKKTKVRCNELGVPVGQNRHKLASFTGMVARTTIPIDYLDWRVVDAGLKEKLWLDILVYNT